MRLEKDKWKSLFVEDIKRINSITGLFISRWSSIELSTRQDMQRTPARGSPKNFASWVWVWVTCAEKSQSSRRNARSRGKERPCHGEYISRMDFNETTTSSRIQFIVLDRSIVCVNQRLFPIIPDLLCRTTACFFAEEDPSKYRVASTYPRFLADYVYSIHRMHRKTLIGIDIERRSLEWFVLIFLVPKIF